MGTARSFVAAAGLAATITGCDRSPTGPTIPGTTGNTPPAIIRLEIVGPSSVAPGEEVQFTAISHRSDATTEDVTQRATWSSNRTSTLTVASGRVTGVGVGEAVLRAQFAAVASREIIVIPTGTFRVVGQITEADSPSTPVSGANVNVIGGSPVSTALSGFDGRYRLYGVTGPVQIRAEKAGYQPVSQGLVVGDHSTVNLVLPLAAPRLHVSGNYTLTVSAASECQEKLPQEALSRRYSATVHQQGPLLQAILSGATFVLVSGKGNSFNGRVEPSRVLFTLSYPYSYFGYYYYYGDIVEQLGESSYLAIGGAATLTGTSDVLEGLLNGVILTMDRDPRRFPKPTAECRSSQHRFRLSR